MADSAENEADNLEKVENKFDNWIKDAHRLKKKYNKTQNNRMYLKMLEE